MGISYPLLSKTVRVSKLKAPTFAAGPGRSPSPPSHPSMTSLEEPAEKRSPSSQVAPGQRACRSDALEPIPLLWEVQNGRMVFPVKS